MVALELFLYTVNDLLKRLDLEREIYVVFRERLIGQLDNVYNGAEQDVKTVLGGVTELKPAG